MTVRALPSLFLRRETVLTRVHDGAAGVFLKIEPTVVTVPIMDRNDVVADGTDLAEGQLRFSTKLIMLGHVEPSYLKLT